MLKYHMIEDERIKATKANVRWGKRNEGGGVEVKRGRRMKKFSSWIFCIVFSIIMNEENIKRDEKNRKEQNVED
jgi:hypothetical protein